MPTTPALARILARLARLRTRIRAIFAVAGASRWIAWAAGLGVAWFLADVLLDLPIGVRRFTRLGLLDHPEGLGTLPWIALLATAGALLFVTSRHRSPLAALFAFATAGVPGVLVWVAARHVVSPLRIPLPDDALAQSVEARFRSLEDRLAAALDFDRELAAPSRGESTAMMAKVVDEAGVEADRLAFATVASGRHARTTALVALGAAGAAATLFVSMGATAVLWARRSLALEDVPWPRRTTVVAVVVDASGKERPQLATTPYVAALGQSLTVLARAEGRVPSEVEIVDRIAGPDGDARPLAHRMRAVPDREGLFEHEFRDVRGDFTFVLRGGDDDDGVPVYAVTVRVPPRITGLRCDLSFPEYLALPTRRVDGGTLGVPEGTKVAVAFGSDARIARAEAYLDDAALPLVRDGDVFRFGFEATKNARYRLRIVTEDGRENDPATDTYDVTVEPDTPPRSEWVYPRGSLETTGKGRAPLFAQTLDDHGIESLRLEVVAGASEKPTVVPLAPRTTVSPDGANDRPYGASALLTYVPLEMATAAVADGKPLVLPTRVRVRVVARDSKGQEAAGPWTSIDVLRSDELERGFAGLRTRAKHDIEEIRSEVRSVADLLAVLSAQDGLSDADRGALRDVQFKVGKSRADLDRAARAVASLFTSYVYARLGAETPTEALLALFDRRHRATFSRATDARSAEPGAAPATPGADADADVFPWALFREVVAARRDRIVFDPGMLDKMITVLEHVVEAADAHGPAAQEAAARVARDPTEAELATLRTAVAAWRGSLDAAVAAMAEWQSLAELTMFLRRLIEEQKAVRDGIKALDRSGAR